LRKLGDVHFDSMTVCRQIDLRLGIQFRKTPVCDANNWAIRESCVT
jgi:hypothetical protein